MALAMEPISTEENGSEIAITSELTTYRVYAPLDPQGNVIEDGLLVTSREKAIAELERKISAKEPIKIGNVPYDNVTLLIEPTFKTITFGTVQAFLDTITDPAAQLARINAGCSSYINTKINQSLKVVEKGQLTFEVTEEPFDTTEWLQESPKRSKQSKTERSLKALREAFPNIDEDKLMQFFAQLAAGTL